jgi:hypothetical protein
MAVEAMEAMVGVMAAVTLVVMAAEAIPVDTEVARGSHTAAFKTIPSASTAAWPATPTFDRQPSAAR